MWSLTTSVRAGGSLRRDMVRVSVICLTVNAVEPIVAIAGEKKAILLLVIVIAKGK